MKEKIKGAPSVLKFLRDVAEEYRTATAKHGGFASAHEGYAVLLEEVDELKEWVWRKRANRDLEKMYGECVQVAAMALKFAVGLCLAGRSE
jgi:hypothetical protein